MDRIGKLNKLFDEGNEIHYWTARGGNSGLDWTELTHKQLSEWGVKFTSVQMKKPVYDYWVDDRAINTKDFLMRIDYNIHLDYSDVLLQPQEISIKFQERC